MTHSDSILMLEATLETLRKLTARMKGASGIHQIDIDLLQQKTRELYEQIILLEPLPFHLQPEPQPEPQPQPENPASSQPEEKIIEDEEIELEEAKKDETEPEPEQEEPVSETADDEIPVPENVPQEVYEDVVIEKVTEENAQEVPEISEPKSTLDLFSESEDDSLGAALEHQATRPNVGEKLEHSPVGDLREAIGINDKFQFVNELFNGDLELYNKVLNELNDFSSLQGALTYLSELTVQYDLKKSGTAFQRLKALLSKKYASNV